MIKAQSIRKVNKTEFTKFMKDIKISRYLEISKRDFVNAMFNYNVDRHMKNVYLLITHHEWWTEYFLRLDSGNSSQIVYLDISDNELIDYSYCDVIPSIFFGGVE